MYTNYRRVVERFDYDENDTVDFSDIMNGPAAIRGVPWVNKSIQKTKMVMAKSPISSPEHLSHDFSENSQTENDLEMLPLMPGDSNIKHRRTSKKVKAKSSPRHVYSDYIQTV